jgi:hypothetical protein
MASKRGGGESSNTGLIVALVFFVLATIGLGVSTYMGYSGKADADKAAKSAQSDKAAADKSRREEQAQKLAVLIATGSEQPSDRQTFNSLRTEALGPIQTQLNMLKHIPRWEVATQGDRPPTTYDTMISDLQRAALALESRRKALESELEEEKRKAAEAISDLQVRLKTSDANFKKAQGELVAEQSKKGDSFVADQAKMNDLSEQVKKLTLDKLNVETELNRQITELRGKLDEFQKSRTEFGSRVSPVLEKLEEITRQRPELHDLIELRDMLSRQFERVQSLANDTPKGQILLVDRSSQIVYINLGSADHVRPLLTFSVLPAGSTGKAAAARDRKGAIEVVAVQGDHISQAKVIDATNLLRDPFLKGDLLFNPVWSPSQQEHIAIAGIIDLNGDGVDDTPELIRQLEKQGIAVDAWVDLKSRSIKGPGMTEKTTYLVLGETPVPPQVVQVDNPLVMATTEVLGKIAEMKAKAKDLGVEPVQYRRFLSLIGYRLPKVLQAGDYSASSYLQGGGSKKPDDGKDKQPK